MSAEAFRWAVLGFGKIARTQLLPAMQAAGHQVVAVGSRAPGGAIAELPGITASSYEAVLANPAVDGVYIATPNHLHVPLTLAALRAGKPVLCEKPMALSLDELQQVQSAADASGRYVQEAFMVAHHPQWQAVRTSVAAELGPLRLIQVAFSYDNRDPANIRNAFAHGGGGLWDIGCYAVWLGQWCMGREPDSVRASATVHADWGTDIHCQGELVWHGADAPTVLQFSVSTQRSRHQAVTLVGDTGWAEVVVPFNPLPEATVRLRSPGAIADEAVQTLRFGPVNQYSEMVKDFAQAVREGRAADLSQSLAITRTLLRLRESAGLASAESP
jgi:predicted dehydrogenase